MLLKAVITQTGRAFWDLITCYLYMCTYSKCPLTGLLFQPQLQAHQGFPVLELEHRLIEKTLTLKGKCDLRDAAR